MTDQAVDAYDPLASVGGAADRPQPRIRLAAPVMGDEEMDAVREVLASGILTNGPATRRFEAAMAQRHGTEFAVAMANGTVGLAAMYLAAGIGPGDEVIVPSLTFIGTATAVCHVGATPVFADILPDTFTLDPSDVVRRITDRTRAIVPVHYAGQAADLASLRRIADDAGVALLEDAAQAHGATYRDRPVGSWGDSAMFSFTPTKNITTGEGAVITTDDEKTAHDLRLLRNHGMSKQYHHEILGYNWRITEMQAAIGAVQLGRLDGILATKRANAVVLDDLLAKVPGAVSPVAAEDRDHPYLFYTVLVPADRREDVAAALDDARIEHRRYFPPIHRQPIFSHMDDPVLPVTEDVFSRAVSVPFHSKLSHADLADIAAAIAAGLS
ncbi:MAG: DegT/DnrJ/EryC1/StrS family aminotransferase [Acidimicrobiales bacterium]|nr:DegT/DnrJ/EryC1/StrS family aminotransferase [Acidimicrobiales bacterium]